MNNSFFQFARRTCRVSVVVSLAATGIGVFFSSSEAAPKWPLPKLKPESADVDRNRSDQIQIQVSPGAATNVHPLAPNTEQPNRLDTSFLDETPEELQRDEAADQEVSSFKKSFKPKANSQKVVDAGWEDESFDREPQFPREQSTRSTSSSNSFHRKSNTESRVVPASDSTDPSSFESSEEEFPRHRVNQMKKRLSTAASLNPGGGLYTSPPVEEKTTDPVARSAKPKTAKSISESRLGRERMTTDTAKQLATKTLASASTQEDDESAQSKSSILRLRA
ncbi:MAG: hypothetical protein FJ267_11550, partial [Planctomycetes bacterium]|nr:hypothetical protein [Planctomycetota bacterium]